MRTTRTCTTLKVSKATYQEIRDKLQKAGYSHAFDFHNGRIDIDMNGIAISEEAGGMK